ncbi:MAG: hypothetical protein QI223_09645 [Candidatus Korarchaeota archaeon]|nr:hypothetical protein [Candidatus Korarchaeota archaeon]
MTLKDSLFWLKLSLASLTGIISGLIGLSATEGLTLFFFTDIAAGTAFLTWKKGAVSEVGVYKAYREFFMTSFLAYFLLWTLTLNLTAGGLALYLAAPAAGVQELRPVIPSENFPYNVLWILNTTDETYTALIGSCAPRSDMARLRNLAASLGGEGLTLRTTVTVLQGSSVGLGWVNVTYQNETVALDVIGLDRLTLGVGEEASADLGEYPLVAESLSVGLGRVNVTITVGPIPAETADFSAEKLGALISRVLVEENRYCVFEPETRTFKRTLRIGDAYVVVRG